MADSHEMQKLVNKHSLTKAYTTAVEIADMLSDIGTHDDFEITPAIKLYIGNCCDDINSLLQGIMSRQITMRANEVKNNG